MLWKLNKSGEFSTKSVYDLLTSGDTGHPFNHIWKDKIPHRIKIFMWLCENEAILTKDNMIKRKWNGDPSCYFCSASENMDHLFFLCPVAKVVWGVIAIVLGASNAPLRILGNIKSGLNIGYCVADRFTQSV